MNWQASMHDMKPYSFTCSQSHEFQCCWLKFKRFHFFYLYFFNFVIIFNCVLIFLKKYQLIKCTHAHCPTTEQLRFETAETEQLLYLLIYNYDTYLGKLLDP